MGIEQDRAQHEASATTAREASKPETSGRRIRERALWRYLSVELRHIKEKRAKGPPPTTRQ